MSWSKIPISKETDPIRLEKRREKNRRGHKKWREKNKNKIMLKRRITMQKYRVSSDGRLKNRVREEVRKAIKAGLLKKLPCFKCGSHESEAHHSDYSKPLQVIWICKKHHGELHRK